MRECFIIFILSRILFIRFSFYICKNELLIAFKLNKQNWGKFRNSSGIDNIS
jgi:hypothetical protein